MASDVWRRFGKVGYYIEPFFGGGSVLLANPFPPTYEVINDLDGYVANFWRALEGGIEELASVMSRTVDELDLNAANIKLREQRATLTERLVADIDYFDLRLAGLWVWGMCGWVDSGFAHATWRGRPHLGANGIQNVSLVDCGYLERCARLRGYLEQLRERMHGVKRMCGDWSRCVGESVMGHKPPAGIFLDPPYTNGKRKKNIYAEDDGDVAAEVAAWAIAHGDDERLRIAVCGMRGEHEFPETWECFGWETNVSKESIWFSPHCWSPSDDLFEWREG